MKTKNIILGFILFGAGLVPFQSKIITNATEYSNKKTLEELIASVDVNYTRQTQMYFTSTSYNEVSVKNKFEFTQSRTTLWINHGLYMHNSTTNVNSGYFSKNSDDYSKLYHYRVEGGYVNYDSSDATILDTALAAEADMNDFFTNLHKMNGQGGTYAAKFTNTANDTWESSDSDVINDFLDFTAPCFTNPLGDWDDDELTDETPYLTFSKVVIQILSNGNYEYGLYVDEIDSSKIEGGLTKFAIATISNIGSTTIGSIASLINE